MDFFISGEFKAISLWLWMILSLVFLVDIKKNYKKVLLTTLWGWFFGFTMTIISIIDSFEPSLIWPIIGAFVGIVWINAIVFKKEIMPHISEHILIIASILTIIHCSINLINWGITIPVIGIVIPVIAIILAIIVIYMLIWKNKLSDKKKLILYKWLFVFIPVLLIIQLPDILGVLYSNNFIDNIDLFAKGYLLTYTVIHIVYLIDGMEVYRRDETTEQMKKRVAENRRLIFSKFSDKQISIKEVIILSILIIWVIFLNKKFLITSDTAIINTIFFTGIARNQFILKKKNI